MLRPDHTVFRTPLPLDEEPQLFPTPERFRFAQATVPGLLPTYEIYTDEGTEGGVVGVPERFEDSPDAEILAGGISRMALANPAIARHGSFVLWGFHGLASHFTRTGERLFLNVIAYAISHGGERVLARRIGSPRAYAKVTEQDRPFVRWRTDDAGVDADAKSLGIATDRLEFLDAVAQRLVADAADPLAKCLVERYVPGVAVVEFAGWLAKNRERLFFTEWGGYVWLCPPQASH